MSQDVTARLQPSATTSRVRQVEDLFGPAGRLEALLNTGDRGAPFSALICHPYPPAGGTMHTKVVYHTMKVLSHLGVPVLRFNFRGVGLSAGSFDQGSGEQEDVRAALNWLYRSYHLPLLVAGFSFGAYVALRASCADQRVIARIALGLPVRAADRDYTYDFLDSCPDPLLFVSGNNDEFSPPQILKTIVGTQAKRKMVTIPEADHFFQGTHTSPQAKLLSMQQAILTWLRDQHLVDTQPDKNPENEHR